MDLRSQISQTITNGVTTSAPSEDVVFDALALKEASLPTMVGNSLKVLRVNAGETDKEWATISSGLTVGTTAIASGTVGRVLFEGAGNVLQQDSTLFWDNTNKRLGVGATPNTSTRLDVRAQGALSTDIALRVRNSADTFNILEVLGNGTVWSNGAGGVVGNTTFGQLALDANTTGVGNTAFGYNALTSVTTTGGSTAIGWGALSTNTGTSNTAIGYAAGQLNAGGTYNTYLGYAAGQFGTTATSCIFIGYAAGQNSNGTNAICIGSTASTTAATGTIAIGNSAITGSGIHSISIGQSSGLGVTSGSYNIHLGYRSVGSGVTTGNYNTLIGGDSVVGAVSNNAVLSDGQGNLAILKDANGNVSLGAQSALATTATNGFQYCRGGAGVPTGVPATAITGHVPMYVDTTNSKMYIYSGGAWVILN